MKPINKNGYTLATVLLLACAAASAGCVGTDAGGNGPVAPTSPEATASPGMTPAQSSMDGLIGEEEARSLAAAALEQEIHGIRIERMAAEPYDVQTYGDVWRFRVKAEGDPDPEGDILVSIDAVDGDMVYFQDGRDYYRPADPAITIEVAEEIADAYLQDRNERSDVVKTVAVLSTVDTPLGLRNGPYHFVYQRPIDDVLCQSDRIILDIDSINGRVVSYSKFWKVSNNDTMADPEPSIPEDAARERVLTYLHDTYGTDPGEIAIRSMELRWYDLTARQRPSMEPVAVPLAWYITFDNDWYRSQDPPRTAQVWIDAHSGEVLSANYNPGR
ncbi:Peptidase propeptide and YPEB domain protein [Methanoculleus chikugoensis]|uniref:Peptidase propeptide and YPEB domain protein n=1 Tax=Methanoculleus chikugoensis TaxID=118126 RepID=A0A1M4MI10_9EURY|nr:YcdB/YcdC domain-containing protein [Methanoculleus chikugoensis]SCL74544.1 Peptidase propeptide and YPEB domain protein [Methanoculleus chikugoensis]